MNFAAVAGILEVLHCILIESPEALNIIQRGHIKSIISLLYKHGRNHKVSSKERCCGGGGLTWSTVSAVI